jgi:RNA polymerase sigma factor (sigma-70 family)
MTSDTTVFVVDDDAEALRSVGWLLESEGHTVETYPSAEQFLDAYRVDRRGCLLLDLQLPELSGLDVQKKLAALGSRLPIIFVSGHGDIATCSAAMRAGAVDFVEKPVNTERILQLVQQALDQDRHEWCLGASSSEVDAMMKRLTSREREVLQLLYEGKSIKTIAATFGISFQTVAKHRSRVLEKLHVANEAELVRLLGKYGL